MKPQVPYCSNTSRRAFLASSGALLSALAWPSLTTMGCRRGSRAINFWGTGTLDIGDWSPFEASHRTRIEFEDNQNDPGPILTRLIRGREANKRHLSGLQGGAERELAQAGAIVPWNLDLIPNFKKLWSWAREIRYTIVDGEHFGIPTVINADSMIYLPERVSVDSYAAVFDPDLRGKTSMEDAWINSVIFTAIYLKESNQQRIQDPGNLTESELDDVMRFLSDKAREGQFRKLWSGWKDGVELITNQEVWVMTGWEPIVYEAQRRGVKAAYAVPREGYEGWSNDMLLHPGAQADGLYEALHEFVDWELSGYYGCKLAQLRGYVVPTDESVRYAELHPNQF